MKYKVNCVGVLTSGGDAPGMNAAVRAITRAAISNGIKVMAIQHGYDGLINGEISEFTTQDVSGIIQRGGTILRTARSEKFRTEEGRAIAAEQLRAHEIDALIVIGGDGSFTGARALAMEHDITVIGVPGTIDNDLWGTDSTIGYDTALNTIMDCVDKLRDTGTSHERVFVVEIMGRDAGFLTLNAAIAAGAEAAIIPERATIEEQIEEALGNGRRKHKNAGILLVQEHAVEGGANRVAEIIKAAHPDYGTRVTILGHLQRGGSPTAADRILASRLGCHSILALLDGQRNIMIGIQNGEIVHIPLNKAIQNKKDIDADKWNALHMLSI